MDEKQLEKLAKLKAMLRSLVVSSATSMNVNNLMRDYRELMGGNLPFFELGYRDVMTFLKERCSDIFIFSGSPVNPTLVPVITDKISHIDKFVSKQRISPHQKYKGKRTRVYETIARQSSPSQSPSYNMPNNTRRDNFRSTIPRFNKSNPSYQTNYDYDPKWTRNVQSGTSYVQKQQDDTPSHYRTDYKNPSENCNVETETEIEKIDKKVVTTDESHIERNRLASVAENTESTATQINETPKVDDDKSETDSGHNTGSIELRRRNNVLCSNLSNLIKEHSEGIWSIELPKYYRDKYNKTLDFERRGFSSVIALCRSLPQVFSVHRPEPFGDWLLMDPTTPVTPSCRPQAAQPKKKTEFAYRNEDALPGIEYDPSVYPSDCLHHLESIPQANLPQVEKDGHLEVIVSEVADPEHFWFQLRSKENSAALEAVMNDMAEYYVYGPGRVQSMVDGAMRIGQYCAASYQGDWHRAIIVQPLYRDKVKVRHIDYGTVERINKSLVRPLPRWYASLPAQAIRGRLGGLRPAAHALRWTHRAAQKLLALVSDKALVAEVLSVDVDNQILTMSLINTLGEEDIYIMDELVNAGLAEAVPDETFEIACEYPPFDALESGKALNYADRAALIRSGICPDEVEDSLDIFPKPPSFHSRNPLAYLIQKTEQLNVTSKSARSSNIGSSSHSVNVSAVTSESASKVMLGNNNYETAVENSVVSNIPNEPANNVFPHSYQVQLGAPQMQYSEVILGNNTYETAVNNSVVSSTPNEPVNNVFPPYYQGQLGAPQMQYSKVMLGNNTYKTAVNNSVVSSTPNEPVNNVFPLSYQSQLEAPQMQYSEMMVRNNTYKTAVNNSVVSSTPNEPANNVFTQSYQSRLYHHPALNPYHQQFPYQQGIGSPYQVDQVNPQANIQIPQNLPQPLQSHELSPSVEARVEMSMTECGILNNLMRTDPIMAQQFMDNKRSQSISMTLLQRQSATSTQSLYCTTPTRPTRLPPGYENVTLEKRTQNTEINYVR